MSDFAMEREIYQQPDVLRNILQTYVSLDGRVLFDIPEKNQKICFVASGSSYHCGVIAAEMMKNSLDLDAEAFYSGEFYMSDKANWEKRLFVFISQSGETSDTLKVMQQVAEKTDNILCISNTENSAMWNLAKYKILTMAGKEESIASTKALSAQLLCVILLILGIQQKSGVDISYALTSLQDLPDFISCEFTSLISQIKNIAKNLIKYESIEILGSRIFYGLSKEGALKIKETSYINTTAYPTGEFMHGHVAVLNKKSAVILLVDKFNYDLCINNTEKIKNSYNPYIITISDENAPDYFLNDENNITINTKTDIEAIFASLVILQLLALECAKLLGRNIDKPIGLSKVVK